MPELSISYGAAQPDISVQLKAQGYEIDFPDHYNDLRIAILRLSIAGVLTEAMTDKCFKRLHNEIVKYCRKIKK